jgi:hypothetical protein
MKEWFEYQRPSPNQVDRITVVREVCGAAYDTLIELCPDSPERDEAIRSVRAAMMWGNASIVFEDAGYPEAAITSQAPACAGPVSGTEEEAAGG